MTDQPKSSILNRIPDIFFRLDEAGRILYVNDAWECWTGIPSSKMKGRSFTEYLPEEDRKLFHSAFEELREQKNGRQELPLHLVDEGESAKGFQVLMRSSENEEMGTFIEGLARNESQAENKGGRVEHRLLFPELLQDGGAAEMETLEARLALFPESAPEPLIECDRAGNVQYMNPETYKMMNELGDGWRLNFLPESHQKLLQVVLETGQEMKRERELKGRVFSWLYTALPELGTVHIRGHDITEQRKVESDMLEVIVRTQEEERERFAKELHEGIGQYLTAILMHFESLRSELNEEQTKAALQIEELIQEAVRDVRGISQGLMPHMLKEFGLLPTLESMFQRMKERFGLEVHLNSELEKERRLDEKLEIGLYRVVQDLVEFSVEKKGAAEAFLKIRENTKELVLEYADDKKTEQGTASQGAPHDLRKFNSRVRSMNGQVDLNFDTTDRLKATVRIPL